MKIINKIKPVHISLIIASLIAVGCTEYKQSEIYNTDKTTSSIDNTEYFPPQIYIPTLENDPLAKYQWHLINQGQHSGAVKGGTAGEDLNISDTWINYQGDGIKLAIVDTGVELAHPDLKANIDLKNSWNYGSEKNDPTPFNNTNESHGTACAGIAAAVGYNDIGVRGVAPKADIVGLDVFSGGTESDFISALYKSKDIDVYSNSWGETYISQNGFSDAEMSAIESGIQNGRNGLGSIYVFSSGNGRIVGNNANFYKEQNNRYVISVGALDANGEQASYSNQGANILVCGYGGEDGLTNPSIVTTDLIGFDKGFDSEYGEDFGQMNVPGNENGEYTHLMNGTSAATPMVAGAVALLLEAGKDNNLTYRDVKYILATTARKNDRGSSSWSLNGAGHVVSHRYGFGVVDIKSAVEKAENFVSLGEEKTSIRYMQAINESFSYNKIYNVNISGSPVQKIEFVEVKVDIDFKDAGDLDIELISPDGTKSVLASANNVVPDYFLSAWQFGTVRDLDENSNGTWQLEITNRITPEKTITLNSWEIQFYGH